MMIVALLRELRLCGLYVKAKETDKKIIQAVKQVINLFTYKAVRTAMNQLYEMNPTEYRWFYDFVTRNKPSDGKHFLRVLVKEKQYLAERVMVTRLHLYAKWIKKCDHAEMYKEISDQNLELMRERFMATVIWPSEMFFNLLLFGQHNLYFDSSNKSHQFSGTNLLLSSFPVMFIAALGCVYLHFQTKKSYSKSGSKSSHLVFWKRPVLAMAPFGIVSLLEITFAAMFVALLIWSLANG